MGPRLRIALVTIGVAVNPFNAFRRHRCLDAADEGMDPLRRLDQNIVKDKESPLQGSAPGLCMCRLFPPDYSTTTRVPTVTLP